MKKQILPQTYTVKFETADETKFARAINLVEQFTMSRGRGKSNYDLCYFLDDEKIGKVILVRQNLPTKLKTLELTSTFGDDEVLDKLFRLFSN